MHMHTNFSHDSKSSPEEMIQGAIEKGLEVICFTDHFDKDNMSWGLEDIFDPEAYFQAMIPLREKYRGRIDVRIGVELGMQPHLAEFYNQFVRRYPFDFVIGSLHSILGKDVVYGMQHDEDFRDVRTRRSTGSHWKRCLRM